MKMNIQFVNMSTSETMEAYTEKKLNGLVKKFETIIKADVFFKKENDSKNKGVICEIELSAPGPRLFASSNEKNYELAVKNTISDLEKQLQKRKAITKPYL
ncbi:ribosome-associated translation inhibitor RaiA [Polaribacter undariae]|uniref:Ribosome-associated translation inhibitor RaiA n=2 Tax=Polaribacter sejongensis TaxID=985043 RepID=A0AAJ1QU43_9FLAO|nr:ribosome-associated translation inhibitor RaiA [Polaribacter undariae]MDN3618293.1 ribosome-associated translation inhibitor RaiA [Polaribacter undariae]UWD30719.1 ribosome-associated translation inhibitor RaiA [Polaribacter undariae]